MSKSLQSLTPTVQRGAFDHCLLTLPVDGSLDDEKGGKNTMALLRKHGENLVPTKDDAYELFPDDASAANEKKGILDGIMASLVARVLPVEEEFHYDHQYHRTHPEIPKSATAKPKLKSTKK